MQLFSKNLVILSILLFNCSISFGMLDVSDQILCDDAFLCVAFKGDGEVKNLLQKTNKTFNKIISQKNNYFLLNLDPASIARIDRENIWLTTDKNEIKEHFKPLEEIKIRSCFKNLDYHDLRLYIEFFPEILHQIPLDKIENVNRVIKNAMDAVQNNTSNTERGLFIELFPNNAIDYSQTTELLQIIGLLNKNNDDTSISLVFSWLKNYKNTILYPKTSYLTWGIFLEESMRRNNQKFFKEILKCDLWNDFLCNNNDIYAMLKNAKGVCEMRKQLFIELYNEIISAHI